jgi:hypothetical protein
MILYLMPEACCKIIYRIEGFSLGPYAKNAGILQLLKNIKQAKKLLNSSFNRKVRESIPPEEINEALERYRDKMSDGKVLIRF